jgi:LmbE family N-acetylglucosaminyl deacetylase
VITPVSDESAWMTFLSGLTEWEPPAQHTLLIAPHPDDETLGPGGLIAALRSSVIEVDVIAITDGEAAYPNDVYSDTCGLAAIREREQTSALAILGVDKSHIHRLRLPDSRVATHEALLAQFIEQHLSSNTHIIAPWRHDFHPDHESAGRAAEKVSALTGARLTSYFFWTWHRAEPSFLTGLRLTSFRLRVSERYKKQAALACHESQLWHHSGDPILPEDLLAPARRPFEVLAI